MWNLSRVVGTAFVLVPVVMPVLVQAQSWPHLDIDERVIPALSGVIRLPIPPGTLSLPVAGGTGDCDMSYVSCSPPLECPSTLGPASIFELANPLAGSDAIDYAEGEVTVMAGGTCYGQGTQLFRLAFPSGPAFTGAEACLACAFEMWAALRGEEVCPANCGSEVAVLCTLFNAFGGANFGPQPAAAGPTLVDTLRALRDQTLVNSAAGQRWIALYDTHSPALSRVLWHRPGLGVSIGKALGTWRPALAALVTGQGTAVTISQAMMDAWLAILDEFAANAPSDTQAAIAAERALLDLPSYVGLTMTAALERFEAGGTPGCGAGFVGADCELAALAADDLCGADPIEAGVLQFVEKRVQAARQLLVRAEASAKTKQRKKLVTRAARQLDAMARRARRAKKTSPACRTTIADLVAGRRTTVTALLP